MWQIFFWCALNLASSSYQSVLLSVPVAKESCENCSLRACYSDSSAVHSASRSPRQVCAFSFPSAQQIYPVCTKSLSIPLPFCLRCCFRFFADCSSAQSQHGNTLAATPL